MSTIDNLVLDFFENSVRCFYDRKLDIHDMTLKFEKILVLLGGLYIDLEYRKWLADCIVHIRDIRSGGHGIRELAYVLLAVFYCYFPDEADDIMRRFVVVGCWSDIKRFLGIWRNLGYDTDSRGGSLVEGRVIDIMVDQLWADVLLNRKSLAAKWVPREKSSYGWLYDHFVLAWSKKAGWKDGRMDSWRRKFRKILRRLNRELDGIVAKIEPKDLVYEAIQNKCFDIELDKKWCVEFDRFSRYCDIPIDTIPIIHIRYDDLRADIYSKIAYAILIAQYGIGRIMFHGYWVVATKSDDFSDIISRIRNVLDSGCEFGYDCYMDMINEASDASGYIPNLLMI